MKKELIKELLLEGHAIHHKYREGNTGDMGSVYIQISTRYDDHLIRINSLGYQSSENPAINFPLNEIDAAIDEYFARVTSEKNVYHKRLAAEMILHSTKETEDLDDEEYFEEIEKIRKEIISNEK